MSFDADALAGGLRAALRELVRDLVVEVLAELRDAAPKPEGYLRTRDAAARAGVTPDTIGTWIGKGLLPATKIGRDWRIAPSDLAAALAGESRGPGPPNETIDLATRARRLAATVKRGSR